MSNSINQPFTSHSLIDDTLSAAPAKINLELINGLLVPGGGNIKIREHTASLPSTISSFTGGSITSIEVTEINGLVYKYKILVTGNFQNAPWNLTFTDQSSEEYHLAIILPVRKSHYVEYNSSSPSIKKITLANAA